MPGLMRYVRAFVIAVRMTVRGEKTPAQQAEARYPRVLAWCGETVRQIDGLLASAEQAGLDKAARESLQLRIEGRSVSLETALGGVRFHAAREYPHLLRNDPHHGLLAVQASNLNDRYTVMQFAHAPDTSALADRLHALAEHLGQIPRDEPTDEPSRARVSR